MKENPKVEVCFFNNDTELSQLAYSGELENCSDITDAETTLTCSEYAGLRPGEGIVTDP